MYGGRLPIPAVKVEDMSTTNREDGKTTIVVLASEPSYSAFGNMVRKWLVCAICALAAVAMNAMWITANAYGDNSSDSSDSSSSSTDSGVTITENITDTENLWAPMRPKSRMPSPKPRRKPVYTCICCIFPVSIVNRNRETGRQP